MCSAETSRVNLSVICQAVQHKSDTCPGVSPAGTEARPEAAVAEFRDSPAVPPSPTLRKEIIHSNIRWIRFVGVNNHSFFYFMKISVVDEMF